MFKMLWWYNGSILTYWEGIQQAKYWIIANNRLHIKDSIDVVRWLTFQACDFKGNDLFIATFDT